ncbi:MAG: hypothetical protein U0Y10_09900 [Spirosomataceae bacterium]
MEWLDSQGKKIEEWSEQEAKREHRLWLDVEKYEEGIYLLRVQSGPYHKTIKVWKVD